MTTVTWNGWIELAGSAPILTTSGSQHYSYHIQSVLYHRRWIEDLDLLYNTQQMDTSTYSQSYYECRLIARSKKTWACNTQIETTTASINPTSHSLEHFVSFAGVAIQQKCTHLHFVGLRDWMQPCKRCMVWCWKSSYYIACIERASKYGVLDFDSMMHVIVTKHPAWAVRLYNTHLYMSL